MCLIVELGYPNSMNVEQDDAAMDTSHDGVSCDGSYLALFRNGDRLELSARLAITDKNGGMKMACYPVPAECLGEGHVNLKAAAAPADTVAAAPAPPAAPSLHKARGCIAKHVFALMAPEEFVPLHPTGPLMRPLTEPVYRSLGGAVPDGAELEPISIPTGVVVKNESGLFLTVATAAFTVEEFVAKFADRETYLNRMRVAVFEAVKTTFEANEIPLGAFFELESDGERAGAPTTEAAINFMELLYPALRAGCDLLMCLPNLDTDVPELNGAYTFTIDMPASVSKIPFFNYHGNVGGEHGTQTVEDNFFVLSNANIGIELQNDATKHTTNVQLSRAAAFMPDVSPGSSFIADWRSKKRQELAGMDYTYGTFEPLLQPFIVGCQHLQESGACSAWETAFGKLAPEQAREKLFLTNLVGAKIPESAAVACIRFEDDQFLVEACKARVKRARLT